ncbi:MAG: hypothetical protein V1676_05750 [Candidatus Diapherotrites archaeon]
MQTQAKTTMSFSAEPEFVRTVEKIALSTGLYNSKSEFLRDAARQRLVQLMGLEESRKRIRGFTQELRAKAGPYRPLTRKQRDALAMRYFEKIRR